LIRIDGTEDCKEPLNPNFLITNDMQNIQIPENWTVYIGRVEDNPAVFRLNLGLEEIAPITQYPQSVRLTFELKEPDENGFSNNRERDFLYTIEDEEVMPLLNESDILAGIVTYQGTITWYFYTENTSGLEKRLQSVVTKHPDYSIQIKTTDDTDWKIYFEFLFPNIYEMQSIHNSNLQEHCEEAGDHTDQERPIEHWLYFQTEKDMNSAITKAESLGFLVYNRGKIEPEEGEDPNEDLGYRLILSKVNSVDNIDPDTWDLIDLVLDTHGEYDGWETVLVK